MSPTQGPSATPVARRSATDGQGRNATPHDSERSWGQRRAGRSAGDWAKTSYYDLPVIHKPHWKWLITTYFFLGGIAGGSYVVASIADLVGGAEGRPIVRVGRFLSFAALLPCPLLLILDLGRPERFFNMLRVVKLRSPMSLGSWGLLMFGGFSALAALGEAAGAGLPDKSATWARLGRLVPNRLVGTIGLLPALFVSGYTGVLLAATAVPLWTRNYLLMGPLFLASALSSAVAAIALVLALTPGRRRATLGRLERLDTVALLAELGLLLAARANLGDTLSRPLRVGRLGQLYRVGVLGLGIVAPLVLQGKGHLRRKEPARTGAMLASVLVLVGGFALRYVMVMAGHRSADDPQATFELTRNAEEAPGAL